MIRLKDMFRNREGYINFSDTLEKWTEDEQDVKGAFIRLAGQFGNKDDVVLSFVSRPGVSYSFRAGLKTADGPILITLIDIVDDPDSRWLSVCFYDECVTDPAEEGNMVPNGVLGIDGYCFDLFTNDDGFISYVEERIDEAYENILKGKHPELSDQNAL